MGILHHLYYKVETPSSPCIIDEGTSIYESSPTEAFLPYSNFILNNRIPSKMNEMVNRMVKIYQAHKKIQTATLTFLITGVAGSGKRLTCQTFAAKTHRTFLEVDAYSFYNENPATSEAKINSTIENANQYQQCVLFIRNAHVIAFDASNGYDRRIIQHFEEKLNENSKVTVIFSSTTDRLNQMPMDVKSLALYTFRTEYLEEEDRTNWLKYYVPNDESLVTQVAKKTSGFTLAELNNLIQYVEILSLDETCNSNMEERFNEGIQKRNSSFADAIGAPKIPNVSWNDVGGLEETKRTVIESIRSSLFGSSALKRSGIILYGQPGCGKTLIAKAVATEFKISFLSVKGPELLNKYVGQSEENLRKVFERARQASPCIIFFDEIDSLAPNRGKNGDSGGVIDRIVSQLLAELDKLHNSPRNKVFVMGATNRPDLLDSSLLMPGRFDKQIEVSPGNDVESKTKILEAIARKMNMDENVDLKSVAAACNESMSGAQLSSIISNAAMQAIIEKIRSIELNQESPEQDVKVTQSHLLASVNNFKARNT
ncbi:unnamed protein product [Caenorhabditis bovis]|uniref:Peroxisomal ATPase PEX1 n=1 Tax=Caenorhabditis bovis TaxID=2654633 RepID=A0A8S1E6Q2_9PELO|nr:unnamed protein product [Caenorhabditis bovis]